jgi:hypothetical protein
MIRYHPANMAYYKYIKYKSKYLQLEHDINIANKHVQTAGNGKIISEMEPIDLTTKDNREIDWYLFFDLRQVAQDIINLTGPNDIIILVGDTPSYIKPFVETHRTTFNFAFSGSALGLFFWSVRCSKNNQI